MKKRVKGMVGTATKMYLVWSIIADIVLLIGLIYLIVKGL